MKNKKAGDAWVLYDASCGYFQFMSGAIPACTSKLGEAHVFDTKAEAMRHCAYTRISTYAHAVFLPIEVEVVWV